MSDYIFFVQIVLAILVNERKKMRMTNKDMAALIGVKETTLSQYQNFNRENPMSDMGVSFWIVNKWSSVLRLRFSNLIREAEDTAQWLRQNGVEVHIDYSTVSHVDRARLSQAEFYTKHFTRYHKEVHGVEAERWGYVRYSKPLYNRG